MSEKTFQWLAVTAVSTACLLAYANSLRNEFVWDDASSIQINQHIQEPSRFFQLFREDQHAFGRGEGNFYRPLLAASFMLDYALSRPAPNAEVSPLLFHVSNIIWHLSAALLLFVVLSRLQTPRAVCLAVSVLFAVHPLNTEAVTYISGRGDPMAASFMLAGLWLSVWEGNFRKRTAGLILSVLCFIAALLSKESALLFPMLLLLVLATAPYGEQGISRLLMPMRRVAPLAAAVVVSIIYVFLRATILRFGAAGTGVSQPIGTRMLEALQSLFIYLRLLFLPVGLHMERTLDDAPGWYAVASGIFMLVSMGVLIGSYRARHYRLACAVGWFFVAWLPISGLFPLNAPLAEHWLYIPMMGFLWALAEGVWLMTSRFFSIRICMAGITAVVCMVFVVLTAARNRDWRDNEALFLDTIAKSPNAVRVHFNLAVTYEDILHNLPGARREYAKVIRFYEARRKEGTLVEMTGDELEAHFSLGRIFAMEQRYDEAAVQFERVLQQLVTQGNSSVMGEAALNLAHCSAMMGAMELVPELLERAVQLNPVLKTEAEKLREQLPPF